MGALEAARMGDQICHSSWLAGVITGALVGLALAVMVVAVIGTGGVAAVAVGAAIVSSGASGALIGLGIGELVPSDDPKGPIRSGSQDTFIGQDMRPAARAGQDRVACEDDDEEPVAQGSLTVFVNGMNLARRGDKTACGATIDEGWSAVKIGGEPATVVAVQQEYPAWLRPTLTAVMVGGQLVATGGILVAHGAMPAVLGLAGSVAVAVGFRVALDRVGGGLAVFEAGRATARDFFGRQQKLDPVTGRMRPLTPAEVNSAVSGVDAAKPVAIVESPAGGSELAYSPAPLDDYWSVCGGPA